MQQAEDWGLRVKGRGWWAEDRGQGVRSKYGAFYWLNGKSVICSKLED